MCDVVHLSCILFVTEYWLGGRWLNGSCLALLDSFISCALFYLLSSFDLLAAGIQMLSRLLLQTSNSLTCADNVNCLLVCQGRAASQAAAPSLSPSLLPPLHEQEELVFCNVTELTGCAWEPQCVTLMTKVSENASPALPLYLPLCLSVAVLVRT